MKQFLHKTLVTTAVALAMCLAPIAQACTGIMLQAADGTYIRARTMEWGAFDIDASITIVPPGYEMSAAMPDGSAGATWTNKYGFVGATGPWQVAGRQTALMRPGFRAAFSICLGLRSFQSSIRQCGKSLLVRVMLISYFLGNFATVAEVREAMGDIRIVAVSEPSIGMAPPVHYFVADPSGDRIVIEVVDQKLTLHDAPLGVITNAPTYDWHMTNLRNYINLSATALPTRTVEQIDFSPLGAGSGMIGLPGDFTPPSRFVRAVAFTQSARPTEGGYDTVRESFRIFGQF